MTVARREQIKVALDILRAVAESIREAGRIPSGHLYAMLMGRMSLETYNGIITTLKNAGLVTEHNFELIWKEPTGEHHG